MKKLIPAIVMLLVSAVVLSTASYAWFTTATEATATGMSVTAKAPTSILIRESNKNQTFGSSVDFAMDDAKLLQPISSADGKAFFYPVDCEDYSGAVKYDTNIMQFDNANAAVAEHTVYYLEFQVDLKNTGTEAVDLVLSKITLDGDAISGAVRVAVLSADRQTSYGVYAGDTITADYIQYPSSADNYDKKANGPLNATGKDYAGTTITLKNTLEDGTPSTIVNLPAPAAAVTGEDGAVVTPAETGEVTLTIRIWFEGQDVRCFSANSGGEVAIDFEFGTLANVTSGN